MSESRSIEDSKELRRLTVKATGFPLYGLVLYTNVPGLNDQVRRYFWDNSQEVHSMSNSSCLVITLEDVRGIVDERPDFVPEITALYNLTTLSVGSRNRPNPHQVAADLGVSLDELPAIVFFEDLTSGFVVVPLATFVSDANQPSISNALSVVFDCTTAAARAKTGKRVKALLSNIKKKVPRGSRLIPERIVSEFVRGIANAMMDQSK
jgi:hypothetical protein